MHGSDEEKTWLRDVVRLHAKEIIRRGSVIDAFLTDVIETWYCLSVTALKNDVAAEKTERVTSPLASASVPASYADASLMRTLDHHGRAAPPASSSDDDDKDLQEVLRISRLEHDVSMTAPPSSNRGEHVHFTVYSPSLPKSFQYPEICRWIDGSMTVESLQTKMCDVLIARETFVPFTLRTRGDNTPSMEAPLSALVDSRSRRVTLALIFPFDTKVERLRNIHLALFSMHL